MRCPRCYRETSATASQCPGCKLPTPKGRALKASGGRKDEPEEKSGFRLPSLPRFSLPNISMPSLAFFSRGKKSEVRTSASRVSESRNSESRKPEARNAGGRKNGKSRSGRRGKDDAPPSKTRHLIVILVVFVLLMVGAGAAYFFNFNLTDYLQPSVDVATANATMKKLWTQPSKEEGKTVDDAMKAQIKKTRDAGMLASNQGWTARVIKGNSREVLVRYTYFEKEDKPVTAEWLANIEQNTFIPKTDLAAQVYGN